LHPLLEQEGRVLVKVVIGCPVYNRGWILDEWWQRSVLDQRGPWDREVVFLYSESGDDTIYKLATFAEQGEVPVTILYDKWARSEEDNVGHFWGTMPVYEKMADWRNRIKNTARESGADYFFSVDSDILLPPGALHSLWFSLWEKRFEGAVAIAPLVNMGGHVDVAGIWNYMSWTEPPQANRSTLPMPYTPFRSDVIMAAMLIDKQALDVDWHPHEQGEDLGWSYDLLTKGMRAFVHPGVVAEHRMVKR
jgi:hypothetical protein